MTGLYPPGSTFKTVTVSAALQAGQVTPDSIVGCPGTENIEGRQIPNDDNFALGDVPLHTAFARSCNTTMGRLAVNLPPDGLTEAAAQLGLGIDYVAPGMTTVTGSVPIADTPRCASRRASARARSPPRRSGWRWWPRRWRTVRCPRRPSWRGSPASPTARPSRCPAVSTSRCGR